MKSDSMMGVIIISIINMFIFMIYMLIINYLINFNYNIAIKFCEFISIPEKISLCAASLGFVNDIVLVLTTVGLFVITPLFKSLYFVNQIFYDINFTI